MNYDEMNASEIHAVDNYDRLADEVDAIRTQLGEAVALLRESQFGAARRATWESDTRAFLSRLDANKAGAR